MIHGRAELVAELLTRDGPATVVATSSYDTVRMAPSAQFEAIETESAGL